MILVTGATSGIGKATVLALAERGASVVATGRRQQLLAELSKASSNIETIAADLSSTTGINAVVNAVRDIDDTVEGRAVTGIVHSAGTPIPLANYGSLIGAELTANVAVHVGAPIDLNNRIVGSRTSTAPVRVVFIDSYSANAPRIGWGGYSIVKAAAQMAARSAAAELPNAEVIRVFPGGVNTPLVEAVLNNSEASPTRELFRQLKAEGELTEPNQVGQFVANILLKATPSQLAGRELWDFGNADDHIF